MKTVKAALVGTWGHGVAFLDYLRRCRPDNVELVAFARAGEGEDFSGIIAEYPEFSKIPVFGNFTKMFAAIKPELAVVTCKPKRLPEQVILALESGCHVYAEKPAAHTVEQLTKLEKTVCANDLFFLMTTGNSANGGIIKARELVASGQLGRVAVVNARKSYPWNDERPDDFGNESGGTAGWVGIHALEFITEVTGQNITDLQVMQSNIQNSQWSHCADSCVMIGRLSEGGHATVSLDYHRPNGINCGDDFLRCVCEKGTVELNLSRQELRITRDNSDLFVDYPQNGEWYSVLPEALASLHGSAPSQKLALRHTNKAIELLRQIINAKYL